ncbi:universal stress protein [Actinomycetospora cinnamomea]|uniref:Nucleotide-binding universal stress UspA family protein n=1 Tax=Actinomycetospora cinnamomea TaxID=663609 RepID=A0A2U1F3T0_9PSEU|nr:universal stress protein [Actinomycetospora cinnamomea]PVZ06818.1 nucleotide-binding universal stress UspA family protein [Actinomycetospora cinnamomea]
MTGEPVVVGVSGEGDEEPAVRWAAAEARALGVHLRLVHGLVAPRRGHPGCPPTGVDPRQGLLGRARQELRALRDEAHGVVPGLVVDQQVIEREPVQLLRTQGRTASLLVIGSHGFGPLGERVLGGVARGLAGHVDVPLVVVAPACAQRTPADARGAVVVGDDGTAGARGALHFAAHRAAARRVPLVVVRAGREARLLPDEVPGVGPGHPPAVHVVIAEDRADRVLAEQSRDAELVVLGVEEDGPLHGRRPLRPDLVRRVSCPVVVVPPGPSTDATAGPVAPVALSSEVGT